MPEGYVLITLDDGNATDYSVAFPYLAQYGMRGSSFICSGKVNSDPFYLSSVQAQEMYIQCWDFGNHSQYHAGPLTEAEQTIDFTACTGALYGWGLRRASSVCKIPGVIQDPDVQVTLRVLRALDYLGMSPCTAYPSDWGIQQVPGANTDATRALIASTVQGGGVAWVYFHWLGTPALLAPFVALVDWIHQQGYRVGTIGDWAAGRLPGVPSTVRACYALDVSANVVLVHIQEAVLPDIGDAGATWTDGEGGRDLDLATYSHVWDEAKRCPRARAGSARYKLVGGTITPSASVLDIDYDAARLSLGADGTLTWLS